MVVGAVMAHDAHLIRHAVDVAVREPGQGPAGDAVMMKLSFDSGVSAWERTSVRTSALYVPALLATAQVTTGQRVLDVATGAGLSAVEAAALIGPSGLVLATDISLPMLERAKRNTGGLPVRLVVMDGHALACRDASFDAVICLLGLMFFGDAARGLAEFRRVLRPAGRVALCVTTTPDRTVYGRVFEAARPYLPPERDTMGWNFALSEPHRLEALLLEAGFRDVAVSREIPQVSFGSLDDYWAAMEAGGGLSGAAYCALSPEDRQAVRDEVRRSLLGSRADGPFAVEMEVLLGSGRQ
jgi:SAM-dependent methyltransferase